SQRPQKRTRASPFILRHFIGQGDAMRRLVSSKRGSVIAATVTHRSVAEESVELPSVIRRTSSGPAERSKTRQSLRGRQAPTAQKYPPASAGLGKGCIRPPHALHFFGQRRRMTQYPRSVAGNEAHKPGPEPLSHQCRPGA